MDMTTFRRWTVPNALRPRMTRIAPMRVRSPPTTPMMGIQPISDPMSKIRTPVFVRLICFRRSASSGDGPYAYGEYPGYAGYGPAGGAADGTPPAVAGPAAAAIELPQFTQNATPG